MSEDAGRFKAVLAALVREQTRHLPFALLYPCRVLKDWGDGHLDLQPEAPYSEVLPPMTRIPLKMGTPGLRVKIKAGAGVWLHFGAGEADAPFCATFDTASVELYEWKTSTGASILIDEDRGMTSDDGSGLPPKTTVEVTHPLGQKVTMDKDGALTLTAKPGQVLTLDKDGNVTITAPGLIKLAGGGPPVARVGDKVQVGSAIGVIIEGSSKVQSG